MNLNKVYKNIPKSLYALKGVNKVGLILLFIIFANIHNVEARKGENFYYDFGLSNGSYNGSGYSEIHAGSNWLFWEPILWRNTIFSRAGDNLIFFGWDSSLRFLFDIDLGKGFGELEIFLGLGNRFSRNDKTGPFFEGGAMIRNSGFGIGIGAKSIFYNSPTKFDDGTKAPKSDTSLFLILGISF